MDENQALRIMTERLAVRIPGVSPPKPDDAPPRSVLLTVPDDWPATIPLPPDAVVIGAVCYSGSPPSTDLIVDVSQDVRHVRAFYLDALSRAGWKPLEQTLRHGGLMHADPMMQFKKDTEDVDGGMYLVVDVQPASDLN
jgi:hypothetical protein